MLLKRPWLSIFHNIQESKVCEEICTNNEEKIKDKQILIQSEDESLIIYGYKSNKSKAWVIRIFYILTLGALRLIFHWFPRWRLCATHSKCDLRIAEKVLVVDDYQQKFKSYFVEQVHTLLPSSASPNINKLKINLGEGYVKEMFKFRALWCKKLCYIWDEEKLEFVKLVGLEEGRKNTEFYQYHGYSQHEQLLKCIPYGKNKIEVPIQTNLNILVLEALTPFYIFQVFSLIVWLCESYYYYGAAIVAMSMFGITISVIQTRRNQRSLFETVKSSERVIVLRSDGSHEEISSEDLVPGDVIEIPKNGCTMQCDAVLLNGNCIVNESMITGESVPVTKTPIPKTGIYYNIKEDSFHTLFCGTKVIQTRNNDGKRTLAVVLRTGFLTTKGELVRSILYPPPSDFKFDRESYAFIGILAVVALLGCLYTVVSKSERSIAAGDIIVKALDLITIVIPPALPATMTIGKLYALGRLKRQGIYCINSRVINVTGSIDCVCFDKTGTLTEDGLDLWGVIPVIARKLQNVIKEPATVSESSPYIRGMATCHSLTIIDSELLGDPLDVKIFQSTGWEINEAESSSSLYFVKPPAKLNGDIVNNNQGEIEILRQYPFLSNLQRMSVVTRSSSMSMFEVFCKGSPEMIASLSKPQTVPTDFYDRMKHYTQKGYRVIALAYKTMNSIGNEDLQKLERGVVESDLEMIGLIVLENRIKTETPGVIKSLKEANIKVMMITGDNIQTALSVAKECDIITKQQIVVDVTVNLTIKSLSFAEIDIYTSKEYCNNEFSLESGLSDSRYVYTMNGTTWELIREYFPDQIAEIVTKGVVFARMSGLQKQQLIQELQKLGFYAAMCGDGANDCGALRTAHVGISLSEEESSVASPFTSKNSDISCVPNVIKEGRAALTTSMGIFKFMICYSLTQFSSAMILYGIDCNLGVLQFLFIDIFLIINFTSVFGKTDSYHGPLSKDRPLSSLLSLTALMSIVLQMFFIVLFQIISYKIIQTYPWFTPFVFEGQFVNGFYSYENYSVFSISLLQYIILVVVFSKGKPYRQPIYTNKILLLSLFVMTSICMYIILYPAEWVIKALELKMPLTYDARCVIIALALLQLACSFIAEEAAVGFFLDKKLRPKLHSFIKRRQNCTNSTNEINCSPKETVILTDNEIVRSKDIKINGFDHVGGNHHITKL